jgi:hypothetical protein
MPDIRIPESPEPFAEWLRTLGDEPAGKAGSHRACPLACYLKQLGAPEPSVGFSYFLDFAGEEQIDTPRWAVRFIDKVDNRATGRLVSAAECLAILEEIDA